MTSAEPEAPAETPPAPLLPRYPIYVPSKGRFRPADGITVGILRRDGVPFRVVVEPQEAEQYADLVGEERLLVLPYSDRGLHTTRNWIKDHSTAAGDVRHWQLDDNMRQFRRVYRGERIPCQAGLALRTCEDFTDRYENVAVSGLNYEMFGVNVRKPFVANVHVYSCSLILNATSFRWRLLLNDDTDYCLQVLAGGWCTILLNAFLADKVPTMTRGGGNTDEHYRGDGRRVMARSLERMWPGVVEVRRRFMRPQHVVRNAWKSFDTPLRLRPDVDLSALPPVDESAVRLTEVKEIRDLKMRRLRDAWEADYGEPPEVAP